MSTIRTHTDGPIRHVVIRPRTATARRLVVLGGVHGNEWAARVAPAHIVRSFMFKNISVPAELDAVEIYVVPEASPEACMLGMRCDAGGGDLNTSWPGTRDPRAPRYQSPASLARAELLAEWILDLEPVAVVGLHAEPAGWCTRGPTAMAAALEHVDLVHHGSDSTDMGLSRWAARHGIASVDVEAPSRQAEAAGDELARRALDVAAAMVAHASPGPRVLAVAASGRVALGR